eukprot:TRINITY_DN10974_c0_g1_i1.p1 TRINITY_DN10974_c0_g1~~TRINITY_DN10974_c0_g1_i1.p1  ORF type:complete len:560 (+),score=123.46 TRINITY_DN10974_c0_g1_i1:1547-3226(+)
MAAVPDVDLIQLEKDYIDKMVEDVKGLKALLLDDETLGIVGLVYRKSTILEKEVFLMDRLRRADRGVMRHLKCIIYTRPTAENAALIAAELRVPKYSSYHIYFSNIASTDLLETIAAADDQELVQGVFEYYGDFYAINPDLFTLNIPSLRDITPPKCDPRLLDRIGSGLASVLLTMKRKPCIRYQANSEICDTLANYMKKRIEKESALFDFRRRDDTLLLIIDRREDAVTPLLTPWTYQAMAHELLGITNNRVLLSKEPSVPPQAGQAADNEVALSCSQDTFFEKNMYSNWGDLVTAVQSFVNDYQQKKQNVKEGDTLEDLRHRMAELPEFLKAQGVVTRHVQLVSAMQEAIKNRHLLDVSALEQDLACNDDHRGQLEQLDQILARDIEPMDCLRLVLLYALRYETDGNNQLARLKAELVRKGVPSDKIALIDAFLAYGGKRFRKHDLFRKEGFRGIVTNIVRGFKDVQNVFTQHEPYLKYMLSSLVKGKLPEHFPYLQGFSPAARDWRPREVIVFIVGGATFEEAYFAHHFNEGGLKVVLGGTSILNSSSYLDELRGF